MGMQERERVRKGQGMITSAKSNRGRSEVEEELLFDSEFVSVIPRTSLFGATRALW